MESLEQPFPVKLICGVLHHADLDLQTIETKLEDTWGPIEDRSNPYPFSAGSSYYVEQMGATHHRTFLSFEGLIDPGELASIKRKAIALELWFAQQFPLCARPVNCDPGLIMRGRMVLATTKDFSHRIYLSQGIYAEVTLLFKKNKIESLPWTYPDIQQGHYHDFLLRARKTYHQDTESQSFNIHKA